jgi:hypothetical protein
MKILTALFLSLALLFASSVASNAASATVGDTAVSADPAPIPPVDVGPPPDGSGSGGPTVSEIVIGGLVVGGAFAIGLASEGGLSAAIASAAAVLLIYSVMP